MDEKRPPAVRGPTTEAPSHDATGAGAPCSERARMRREQILSAAATCFARDGFHGTSVSKICTAAGMSAGHIYHFFPNKESIVVGIVERQALEWHELLQPYDPANVDDEFVERMIIAFEQRTRPEFIAIWHEVLSETTHNPTVSSAVRKIDEAIRRRVVELLLYLRKVRGVKTDTPLEAIAEVALALYEGLSNRATLNPDMDKAAMREILVAATVTIVEA